MNKKLIAVAVAGMFVAPAVALAQSSVTITGKVIATVGNYKLGNQVGGGNSSEGLVKDESSRVIFMVREDLGGGLAAVGKFDFRPGVDSGAGPANTGESYIALTSPTMGTLGFGRYDLHYGNHASYTGVHSGLLSNPTALFDVAGAGAVAIARQSRTDNVIRYGSPKFGNMFEIVLAYSTSGNASSAGAPTTTTGFGGATQEADLRSANRKGSAWNLAPKLFGTNWEAGYSYWTNKGDVGSATASTTLKSRGDSLYGTYLWGGFRAGLAFNRSKVDVTTGAGATTEASKRTVWGIPLAYTWGQHNIYFDFYKAGNDKAGGGDSKANFLGLTYAYDLSKRTAVAASFARIRNGADAAYNLFSAAAPGAAAGAGFLGVTDGEDPRFLGVTMRHNF